VLRNVDGASPAAQNANEELAERGTVAPYGPTHRFDGLYLNARHASYANCPLSDGHLVELGVPGWLRREDALKLYELAFFACGSILELGTYHGLSTSIMAQAQIDSGRGARIVTVDLDASVLDAAQCNLERLGVAEHVRFVRGEAVTFCQSAGRDGTTFDLVFIDHDHGYESVLGVCRELARLTTEGGYCLFHDWQDPRNFGEGATYGVVRGTRDGLDQRRMKPCGVFGTAALYRRL
jgi:cephalosporin hydroxylase